MQIGGIGWHRSLSHGIICMHKYLTLVFLSVCITPPSPSTHDTRASTSGQFRVIFGPGILSAQTLRHIFAMDSPTLMMLLGSMIPLLWSQINVSFLHAMLGTDGICIKLWLWNSLFVLVTRTNAGVGSRSLSSLSSSHM